MKYEIEKWTFKKLKNIFKNANNSFLKNDSILLEKDVSERSWYSRIAICLNEELKKEKTMYVVDTEYNRNMGKVKTIKNGKDDIIRITCDIIIHSRGILKNHDNLLCIEIKKANRPLKDREMDKKRLEVLTQQKEADVYPYDNRTQVEGVTGYLLGIYYEANIQARKILIEYYENGKCIENEEIPY